MPISVWSAPQFAVRIQIHWLLGFFAASGLLGCRHPVRSHGEEYHPLSTKDQVRGNMYGTCTVHTRYVPKYLWYRV